MAAASTTPASARSASLPRPAGAPPLTETPGYPFQLTIADVGTLQILDRIRFDNGIRPWEFTPDEKGLYAQLSNEHAVVAYNLAARKVVKRLDLPVKPGVTAADWDFEAPHHGLALTPDGRTLCLAGRASDYAALVRAPDLDADRHDPGRRRAGLVGDRRQRPRVSRCQYPQRRPVDHLDP